MALGVGKWHKLMSAFGGKAEVADLRSKRRCWPNASSTGSTLVSCLWSVSSH